jgi:chorismate synthase
MLRFLTAGESHGQALVAILEGMPAGLAIDFDAMTNELRRRQTGYGRGRRMAIESDRAQVLSGVRGGLTTGGPIALLIPNKDWQNWQRTMAVVLERASARETAARVAVGAIARQLLLRVGTHIVSHVVSIGSAFLADPLAVTFEHVQAIGAESPLRCVDAEVEGRMIAEIDRAREAGDTMGGTFEVIAHGVPPGLGSHVQWDRKLDGRLAQALMCIPAIKAVGIGRGHQVAALPGSRIHDEILPLAGPVGPGGMGVSRPTNNAGGLEGGITNGEDLRITAAMKPIATLMKPLRSVDLANMEVSPATVERSDVCAVPAAAVVGEAMVALVLADALTEKFGGDSIDELVENWRAFRSRTTARFSRT